MEEDNNLKVATVELNLVGTSSPTKEPRSAKCKDIMGFREMASKHNLEDKISKLNEQVWIILDIMVKLCNDAVKLF